MNNVQTILMAVGSAITGGGFLKFLEFWLNKSKQKNDQDKAFRDELRGETDRARADAERLRKEIDELKNELRAAEKELDDFKIKYWDVYMQYKQFQLTVYGILLQNGIKPDEVLPKDIPALPPQETPPAPGALPA